MQARLEAQALLAGSVDPGVSSRHSEGATNGKCDCLAGAMTGAPGNADPPRRPHWAPAYPAGTTAAPHARPRRPQAPDQARRARPARPAAPARPGTTRPTAAPCARAPPCSGSAGARLRAELVVRQQASDVSSRPDTPLSVCSSLGAAGVPPARALGQITFFSAKQQGACSMMHYHNCKYLQMIWYSETRGHRCHNLLRALSAVASNSMQQHTASAHSL